MKVLIAGANGKIGHHLIRKMATSQHLSRAMIRSASQTAALENLGATETIVGDLEKDCSHALQGCDAVVFLAGSGPHTGPEKTVDVDQEGAMRLVDAARRAGIGRFIMVSSMRVDNPEQAPQKIHHYLAAKARADEHLRGSGLDYTIVRPGPLTNDPGTGLVDIKRRLERKGSIPREDVAAVLLAILDADNTRNVTFDLLSGTDEVVAAVTEI